MEVILTETTSSGNNLVLYLCNMIYHIYIHDIVMGHASKGNNILVIEVRQV